MGKLNVLPQNPEKKRGRFPSWLHRNLPQQSEFIDTTRVLKSAALPTVCEEAKCPNRFECYSRKTATFLVLGKQCTRACGFCDIDFSKNPMAPAQDEPQRIVDSVQKLGLKHVVITQVARDDLPLGGAEHVAEILKTLQEQCPEVTTEVLTSDFEGKEEALDLVLDQHPAIFNHNIETVERLSDKVRHKARFARSLDVLSYAKSSGKTLFVKSGIMVGLGETLSEVEETLDTLKKAGCDVVTIGQYLQPSGRKLTVKQFINPIVFRHYRMYGEMIGLQVYAGPFVRSSYNADQLLTSLKNGSRITN